MYQSRPLSGLAKQQVSYFSMIARLLLIIILLLLGIGIGLYYLIQSVTLPSLSELKTISEIANNLAIAVGLVIGGIWTYFGVIRGRTFAPKLKIDTTYILSEADKDTWLVYLEASIENIGANRIITRHFNYSIEGNKISNGEIEKTILAQQNAINERGNLASRVLQYIEPGEADYVNTVFTVPKTYHSLSGSITYGYNRKRETRRVFFINTGKSK